MTGGPRAVTPAARLLIACVRAYQATLSPFLGGHCRFQPTCSVYAIEALTRHGARRGGWLTIRRLSRCHPCGGFGADPVPDGAAPATPDDADRADDPGTSAPPSRPDDA